MPNTSGSPSANISLARALSVLAPVEGPNSTRYAGVTAFRVSPPQPPMPTLYDASLIVVGQGRKRGYWRDQVFDYGPEHYLVLTSPTPMLREIVAKGNAPVLSAAIEIDLSILSELFLDVKDSTSSDASGLPLGVYCTPITSDLESAVGRLLRCLSNDLSTRILARQTLREILYYVLIGPHGGSLRTLANSNAVGSHLVQVIRHMNERYPEPLEVGALAKMAHMSVPTFHRHFRRMTSSSPLQYLKAVRLTKARALMLQTGLGVAAAAHAVGYESTSQFSREFRRFFGTTPIRSLRKGRAR